MRGAVMYLQLSAPALWFYVMAECLKRYLLAQVCLAAAFRSCQYLFIRIGCGNKVQSEESKRA